jgi:hypothetical protein
MYNKNKRTTLQKSKKKNYLRMPAINVQFLKTLQTNYKHYLNFIETGTYMGETILHMEPYFSKLYTIEIKKEFYEKVKQQYTRNKIHFYLGDSSQVLSDILPVIKGKSIIFLDGHWSAGNTGKGKNDCPLYEELQHIMDNHQEEAIIIVDDVRLFGQGPNQGNQICNWENINVDHVMARVQTRMTQYYFLPSSLHQEDRLIIHIRDKGQKLHLENMKYYFLNYNNEARKHHMEHEFEKFHLQRIYPVSPTDEITKYRSGATGFMRMLTCGIRDQDTKKCFQPFCIMEDDVKEYREFPKFIDIPTDTDLLYIGLSKCGLNPKTFLGEPKKIYCNVVSNFPNLIRPYNMLALHGLIICSMTGLLTLQKCIMEDYFLNRDWDISIALTQPYLNVYALRKPLVYQCAELNGQEIWTKFEMNEDSEYVHDVSYVCQDRHSVTILTTKW